MADLAFDAVSGRFRDPAGRYISDAAVRRVVDQIADTASDRLAAASTRLLAGELSLASWQAEAMQIVKTAHVATSTIAAGGAESMTFSTYGAAGQRIRGEYGYLRGMAEDIASGAQKLDGSLTARARQYGQGARITYETARARGQQARGYRFERNVLHAKESCNQCRSVTAQGWVPIGTLPPVGSRTCRAQCRCTVTYAREAARAA